MATYAELTQEQKDSIQNLANMVRATAGEAARIGNHQQAIASGYNGNIENILALITSNDEIIPNSSSLSGAQSLTKIELVNLIGYCLSASAIPDGSTGSYNTNFHRSLYAKAAGPSNLIG